MNNINDKIELVRRSLGGRHYVKDIYDPVQNLAVYDITSEYELKRVKETLKSLGAKRFRKIKSNSNIFILLF